MTQGPALFAADAVQIALVMDNAIYLLMAAWPSACRAYPAHR